MPDTTNLEPPEKFGARARILRTAHDLFYRDGVRSTGVDTLIATAGVTKVTFYRHFPSKDDLILAFLNYRHELWMAWFVDALARHRRAQTRAQRERSPLAPAALALAEWIRDPAFRGCAFINIVAEFGDHFPRAVEIAVAHKRGMTTAIANLLDSTAGAQALARATAIAIDGAIVRAQVDDESASVALAGLNDLLDALTASRKTPRSRVAKPRGQPAAPRRSASSAQRSLDMRQSAEPEPTETDPGDPRRAGRRP